MHVNVDKDLCQGSGYCAQIAPEVFEIVDGLARVVGDDSAHERVRDAVREAETVCPAAAIRL